MRVVVPQGEVKGSRVPVSRRSFLLAAGSVGAGLGVAGCAFGPNARHVEATRHVLPITDLPPALDGLRIAHVTDMHFPANHAAAARALAILAEERPDVVIHTGDMVETWRGLDDLVAFATLARGTLATVAVRGNWEGSAGIGSDVLARTYAAAGVTYLQNDVHAVRVGTASLALAGLDDPVRARPDPAAIRRKLEGDVAIWALHGPGYADLLPPDTPAHLLLAGHTHGGQIRLPFLPGLAPSGSGRFLAGWYDTPAAPLYVSRGVGTTTVRARLFCPAELPLITLTRAGQDRRA